MKTIRIDQIAFELSPVVRFCLSGDVISDYAELLENGTSLPEPHVFIDGAGVVRLADGRHRVEAAMRLKLDTIKCETHEGGFSEALEFAASCNCDHGLRRTNADKRVCIQALLKEFPRFSDRKLATMALVSDKTVGSVRKEMECGNPHTPVGIKSAPKEKRMGARQCGEVDHVTPPPPPDPPRISIIPLPISQQVSELVREAMRLQNSGPAAFHEPAFRHFMSRLLGLQKMVQPPLPGMDEHFAPPANKAKCTLEEAMEFCKSIELPASDGDAFYYHMVSQGWKTKGGVVKDWQATIRKWKAYGYMASQKRAQGNGHGSKPQEKHWASKEIDAEAARLKADEADFERRCASQRRTK